MTGVAATYLPAMVVQVDLNRLLMRIQCGLGLLTLWQNNIEWLLFWPKR